MIKKIGLNISLLLILIFWVAPILGLLLTSLRDSKHANETGFWRSLTTNEIGYSFKTRGADDISEQNGRYIISGNLFNERNAADAELARKNNEPPPFLIKGAVTAFGSGAAKPREAAPGESILVRGGELSVSENGDYQWVFAEPYSKGGKTIGVIVDHPPALGPRNYIRAFSDSKIPDAVVNSFIVTIPATVIPITIAAFAAYAFSWMRFPGRDLLFVIVTAMMVVPLQLAFIPVLSMYARLAEWATALNVSLGCQGEDCAVNAKTFAGLWAAHTAFGLPLAIYLLRNYIVGLPHELIESARVDGASHLKIFTKIVVPLSVPALASFGIFQFLWVWNDLLVALILGPSNDLVLPIVIQKQIGTFKSELERLNASAFISMIVPLIVFLSLQKYFVRGLLAGSVKGG
ncbi:MAG: carbohydrate ABC transporter permease [Alphaproteobacteria bacterium]|nr:carbohydrate ABC transporter permease [Alphaproteobacteria bacterium]MDA7987390.1 carbohydrate ABC transporter permease [Alphaproteobacteria bacterium]MDA8000309.1 carbohydrate ABC transporter permease [Alphaproteobacteria bacterium]MDA8003977.1 carbohydrate ABC transporter permease [Alphaproteobacteria bacterium]MDA8006091.1 carbohydrate ABC transporter permease [Alphaproteobacteria bacterium]